ncbi:MAG TPA: hypothetical protein PKB15_07955 [Acidimicrobiia bacterium]|nr:hypothetical protein [Acidimicrobiia bacterium]
MPYRQQKNIAKRAIDAIHTLAIKHRWSAEAGCKYSEVAVGIDDIRPHSTRVLVGDLTYRPEFKRLPTFLRIITGDFTVNDSPLTSLGGLAYVAGNVSIHGTNMTSLNNLFEVGGTLTIAPSLTDPTQSSKITSLGHYLKKINSAHLEDSIVNDWGAVEEITGDVHLSRRHTELISTLKGKTITGRILVEGKELLLTKDDNNKVIDLVPPPQNPGIAVLPDR